MSLRHQPEQFETVASAPEAVVGPDPVAVLRMIAVLRAAELEVRANMPRGPLSTRAHGRSGHVY